MALQLPLVLLVLVAAVLHALWNAALKSSGERFLTFTAIRATGTMLGLLATPFVAFPAAQAWPFLIAGFIVHNVYYVFLLFAYRIGDLSQVYPLARGSAPVVVAVLALLAAHEVPGPGAVAGVALVSLGIAALSFAGGGGGPAGKAARPVALALATGLVIAGYTVLDGIGIRRAGTVLGFIAWLNVLEGLPFLAVAAAFRGHDLSLFLARHWKRGLGLGLLPVSAYGLVLYALSRGAMAPVTALRETSVLFAALIGCAALGEPFGARRIAAAALIVAGVVAMQTMG